MLSPIYRRCGIELTRITPTYDRLIRTHTTKGEWMVYLEENKDAMIDKVWNHFRSSVMLAEVYEVAQAANPENRHQLWEALCTHAQLTTEDGWIKNPTAEFLRTLTHDHLNEKASKEQALIVKAAKERFRGLYHPRPRATNSPTSRSMKYRFWQIGYDPMCVELSSAPMMDWDHFQEFFTLSDDFLDEQGCLRNSDYITGPGGHIHIAMRPKHVFRLKRQLLNHPWILFAFCDPRDDQHWLENCPEASFHRKAKRLPWHPLYRHWREREANVPYPFQTWMPEKSGSAIAYRDGPRSISLSNGVVSVGVENLVTAEWRLFDIAQTWEMQEEHLAFAQAFTEYAIRSKKPETLMSYEEAVQLSTDKLVAGFRALIKTLKLPWSRYRDYVYNIEARMELRTRAFAGDQNIWGTEYGAFRPSESYNPEAFRMREKAYDQSVQQAKVSAGKDPLTGTRTDVESPTSGNNMYSTRRVVTGGEVSLFTIAGGMTSTRVWSDGSVTVSSIEPPFLGDISDTCQDESVESVSGSPDEGGVLRRPHAGASDVEGAGAASPDIRCAEGSSQGGEAGDVAGDVAAGAVEGYHLSSGSGRAVGIFAGTADSGDQECAVHDPRRAAGPRYSR